MGIFKKIKSVLSSGVDPAIEGRRNYKLTLDDVEQKAISRSYDCLSCDNYEDEPIDMFQVEDKRIPELSGKMCDVCECPLPYLLRQDSKICKYWKNDSEV